VSAGNLAAVAHECYGSNAMWSKIRQSHSGAIRRSFAVVSVALAAIVAGAMTADARKRDRLPPDSAPVAAGDAAKMPLWHYLRTGEGPVLRFGPAQGDASVLVFSCAPGSGVVRILAHADTPNVRRGDAARLLLSNGKARIEIAGTAFADAKAQRLVIGGTAPGTVQFLDVFRGGETLTIELPGRKAGRTQRTALPLKSLGNKAQQFAALCTGKG
jgi:hypothetical protein